MASPSSVISLGYGSWGSTSLVVTLGYGISGGAALVYGPLRVAAAMVWMNNVPEANVWRRYVPASDVNRPGMMAGETVT